MNTQPVAAAPSSAAAPARTELTLRSRHRELHLDLSPGRYLYAVLRHTKSCVRFAYVFGPRIDCGCRLMLAESPSLWLGDTALYVSAAEAAEIQRVYAPLGLKVTRDET